MAVIFFVVSVVLLGTYQGIAQSAQRSQQARDLENISRVAASVQAEVVALPHATILSGEWQPPTSRVVDDVSYQLDFDFEVPGSGVSPDGVEVSFTVTSPHGLLRTYKAVNTPPRPYTSPTDAALVVFHTDPLPALAVTDTLGSPLAVVESPAGPMTILRVPGGCTSCRVGLSASLEWSVTDTVGLTSPDTLADVRLPVGSVTYLRVDTAPLRPLSFNLLALTPGTDLLASPPFGVEGSLCLWVGDSQPAPLCNLSSADVIDFTTYTSAGGHQAVPPVGEVVFSVDHPSGTCPAVSGLRGHTVSGWAARAVCPSWTWGYPSAVASSGEFDPDDASQVFSGEFTLDLPSSPASWDLVWVSDNARPATGFSGEQAWMRPREAPGCGLDGTCRPLGADAPAPEASYCPLSHCFSAANYAPVVIAPSLPGSSVYALAVSPDTNTPFSVDVVDPDGDYVELVATSLPTEGLLVYADSLLPVPEDEVLAAGQGEVSVELIYQTGPDAAGIHVVSFAASDASATTNVDLNLVLDNAPTELICPSSIPVIQGASDVPVVCEVLDGFGQVFEGAVVNFTPLDPYVSVAVSSDTSSTSGEVSTAVSVGAAPAGSQRLGVSIGSVVVSTVSFEVVQVIDTLSATPTNIPQGASGALLVSAVDLAGGPMPGVVVSPLPHPTLELFGGCTTGLAGTCLLPVAVPLSTPADTYQVELRSGEVTTSGSLTVTPSVASVDHVSQVSLYPGESTQLLLRVVDGAGNPVIGVEGFLTLPPTVSAPTSFITDNEGYATVEVSVPGGTAAQSLELGLSVGSVTSSIRIDVLRLPGSVLLPTTFNLPVLQLTPFDVYVSDTNGAPLGGVEVVVSVDLAGVTVGPAGDADPSSDMVATDASGRARFYFYASSEPASGVYEDSIEVVVAHLGASSATLVLPSEVFDIAVHTLAPMTPNSQADHVFRVLDHTGTPVVGAEVVVSSASFGVPFPVVVSDSDGFVTVRLVAAPGLAPGPHTIHLTSQRASLSQIIQVAQPPS